MFSASFTSLSFLLLFSLSITFFVVMHSFDSISSNIDEVLSINPSANVFVFGDFNIHHKDWLTYFGGTDRPRELCHSPSLLDLFISSDASICFTMVFPPLGDFFLSVSIDLKTRNGVPRFIA